MMQHPRDPRDHGTIDPSAHRQSNESMQLRTPQPDEAMKWYLALSPADRRRFLASLAHNLTIAGRCFFNAFAPERSDTVRARQINELLHKVTGVLSDPQADKDTSSAAGVSKYLLEQPDAAVREQVVQAWHYAMEAVK